MFSQFTILDCAMAMDGGSLSLLVNEETGKRHTILIPQYHEPNNYIDSRPPGSLILDGKVVDVRGEEEREILYALTNAKYLAEDIVPNRFPDGPHVETSKDVEEFMSGSIKKVKEQTVKQIIDFIISEKYIELAVLQNRYRKSSE